MLMTLDKPTYQTGDKAKVLFKAPFDGKLLVTVERNRVLEQHWLTTNNKSAEWSFSVGSDHLPNVYVTATLIRAIDEHAIYPSTVAHGFAPVSVQDAGYKTARNDHGRYAIPLENKADHSDQNGG